MQNIKKVEHTAKTIKGLQVRIKNVDELHIDTENISPLLGRFYNQVFPTLEDGATVYGVYQNYESDKEGEFDVLVGTDTLSVTEEMKLVELEAGKYLLKHPVIEYVDGKLYVAYDEEVCKVTFL